MVLYEYDGVKFILTEGVVSSYVEGEYNDPDDPLIPYGMKEVTVYNKDKFYCRSWLQKDRFQSELNELIEDVIGEIQDTEDCPYI